MLSTPRSGTLWLYEVLHHLGLDIGHELMGRNGTVCGFWAWRDNKVGYLPCKHESNIAEVHFDATFHLVRHPLKSLRSLYKVFSNQAWHGMGEWCRAMGFADDPSWQPKKVALRYWAATHRRLYAQNLPRIRLEDIQQEWPKIAGAAGVSSALPEVRVRNSMAHLPPVNWDKLEALDFKAAKDAQALAKVFGY